jgi:aminopeptidase N
MVSSLLGEEAFFKGVALYLKERQFSNSVAEDLWDALRRTSGNLPFTSGGLVLSAM